MMESFVFRWLHNKARVLSPQRAMRSSKTQAGKAPGEGFNLSGSEMRLYLVDKLLLLPATILSCRLGLGEEFILS